ncbi:MAG: hypothetical protein Q8R28_19595 [Dehalococcoidia bacterium]|nr:hypothetical protein [Dehalococcoidia bacterium]
MGGLAAATYSRALAKRSRCPAKNCVLLVEGAGGEPNARRSGLTGIPIEARDRLGRSARSRQRSSHGVTREFVTERLFPEDH